MAVTFTEHVIHRCATHRGSMVGLLAALSSSRVAHCPSRSSVAFLTCSSSSSPSPSLGQVIWLRQRKVLVKSAPARRTERGSLAAGLNLRGCDCLWFYETLWFLFCFRVQVSSHIAWCISDSNPTCAVHGLQQVTDHDLILWLVLFQQAQLLPHVLEVESIIQSQILVHDSLGSIRRQLRCQSLS